MLKNFLLDEQGMGTVELVLIIAALVAIAVALRKYIFGWFDANVTKAFEGADVSKDKPSAAYSAGG